MSLDNLFRPRSLALNLYLTVMTCGVWLFVWASARRRASPLSTPSDLCGCAEPMPGGDPAGMQPV